MTLHPQVEELIATMRASGIRPLHEHTLAELRAGRARLPGNGSDQADSLQVQDEDLDTTHGAVTVRIYTPSGPALKPLLVWLHGGGWVSGSVEGADQVARRLARGADCVLASLDYPLAPENPFPVALEACAEILAALAGSSLPAGADPARIVLGGDSAGANIAAVLALRSSIRLAGLLLVCPLLDAVGDLPSRAHERDGYLLTGETIEWFVQQYLPVDVDRTDPRVSPLRASVLSSLPPTHVITAEHDPLRDEGEAFVERLRAAGVIATGTRYDGMIHGFFSRLGALDASDRAVSECAATVKALAGHH